jgi:alpha-tubulin suppressor-like RCC1 family protein
MHGEMTRSVGLVGCVTVTIALGSCGSGGIAIGVDAGPADAPMATLADGASGDAVRGDADVLPAQADAPMATGDAGADGGHVIPVAVSAGLFSTCALLSNGTARCWGYNYYGQLGNATTTDSTTPVVVQGLNDAVSISASDGYHACAVRANGTAQCWGGNLYGDLGDGTMVDSSSIKTVLNLYNIATISTGGNATCAALVDGTAYCWGEASGVGGGRPYRFRSRAWSQSKLATVTSARFLPMARSTAGGTTFPVRLAMAHTPTPCTRCRRPLRCRG